VPVGVAVAGANRHDVILLEATLASIPVPRPRPTRRRPQGVCLDKGYDITWVYRLLIDAGFTPHVRAIREDALARRHGTRARRWVVERTHSWMNRFRGLLVRWEIRQSEGSPVLGLLWEEIGMELTEQPTRRGFGMELLERTLPYELDASTAAEFLPTGFRFTMELPLANLVVET